MPSIEYMRNEVKRLYSKRKSWAKRVSRMPDRQIMAIYFKELAEKDRIEDRDKRNDEPPSQDQIPF